MGQESIARRDHAPTATSSASPRSSRCTPRCSPSDATRPGTQVQIAYAIAGKGLEPVTVTRGFLYSVRVRFVGDRLAGPGRGRRSIPPGTSSRPRRCPTASTWSAGCRAGAPGPLRVPAGHPAGRGSGRRPAARHGARRAGRRTVSLGAERPGARQPQRQPGLAAHRPRTPSSSIRCRPSSASEEMQLYYEVEGVQPAARTRCGSRCESRVGAGACSGRSSAAAARPSASSSTPRPRRSDGIGPPRPAARQLEAGEYVLEVAVTDAGGQRDQRVQPFQVVDE